jgi:hypothetical protein
VPYKKSQFVGDTIHALIHPVFKQINQEPPSECT